MVAAGPFDSPTALFAAAETAFDALTEEDWREAFAAHARIGDRAGAGERGAREQAGVATANGETLRSLARLNAEYEARYGHVFLICASGQTAAAMLAALRGRLGNPSATELRIAATEQRKITRLRLEALI